MSSIPTQFYIGRLNGGVQQQSRIVNGFNQDDDVAQLIGYEVQELPAPSAPTVPSTQDYIPPPSTPINPMIRPFTPNYGPTTYNGVVLPPHTPLAIPQQQSKYSNILFLLIGLGLLAGTFLK